MRKILPLLLAALVLLTACSPTTDAKPAQPANPIEFYYCAPEDASRALQAETRDLARENITVQEILSLYFAGPEQERLQSPFPDGLKCEAVSLENGILTLQLSSEFAQLQGIALSLAEACLTMTLMQIHFVERVRLQTSGETLSQRTDALTEDAFLLHDSSAENPETSITLYFAGVTSWALQSEHRKISSTNSTELPKRVMQELLNGPDSDALRRVIPVATQMMDASVADGVCTVLLSDSFAECDTNKAAATLAVHSIVATLCQLEGINAVRISLVDGSDLQYCSIAEALTPEESWY